MALEDYLLHIGEEILYYLQKKGLQKADAEDILQNTFYKVLQLTEVLAPEMLRPWMYRVAINEMYDFYRKQKTKQNYLKQHQQTEEITDAAEQLAQVDLLQKMLNQLPDDYRDILLLKYYFDMSYKEIAATLSLKPDNVKTKLYRARKAAQKTLEGEEKYD